MLEEDTLAGPVPLTRHELLSTSTASAVTLVSAPQATLEVTTLADTIDASDGLLSLREAIIEANGAPGADTITFADSIRGGTIELVTPAPTITDALVIDGDPFDRGPSGITLARNGDPEDPGTIFEVADVTARFEDLSVGGYDGTAIAAFGSALTLERVDLDIVGNISTTGVQIIDGSLGVIDSTLSANAEEAGFAISFDGTSVTLDNSQVLESSGEYGGGILGSGTFRMVDSSLVASGGSVTGGALLVSGKVEIANSTFAANFGGPYGPGGNPLELGGDVTIVNSTFAGNSSYGAFAGTYIEPGSTARIVNSTFTGTLDETGRDPSNEMPTTGLRIAESATVTIANSIIDDTIDGTIVSNGANTFRDTAVDGSVAGDRLGVGAGELFAQTEEIGSSGVYRGVLADNGGPTETAALLNSASNPALDNADPADAPTTDQRGYLRDSTPDIGAFELDRMPPAGGSDLVVTTLDDVVSVGDGVLSLREAIEFANFMPGADTITFADAIRGGTIMLDMRLGPLRSSGDLIIDGDPLDAGKAGIVLDAQGDTLRPDLPFSHGVIEAVGSSLRLEDVTVTNWYGAVNGVAGRISGLPDGDIALYRSELSDGAGEGAAGAVDGGAVRIVDSTIKNIGNEIVTGIAGDTIEIIDSTISNIGGEYGVAIAGDTVRLTGSTISDVDIDVIGQLIDAGTLEIENSTIARNVIDDTFQLASAIIGADAMRITNSTIVDNGIGYFGQRGDSPGIAGGSLQIENSIVMNNGSATTPNILGPIISNGSNILSEPVQGTLAGDVVDATIEQILVTTFDDRFNKQVALLADNGGPTPTVALLDSATNPALDRADPADAPATDQRGYLRDATPDIGAFELDGVPPTPPNTLPPLAEKVPLPDSEIYGAPLFLVGPSGDAEIAFVDEVAAFQSSLGVYLVGPDGTIGAASWVFERIEHSEASSDASAAARPGGGPLAPGDAVQLSELFDPADLTPGTGFGLFLVANGWALNDAAIFEGGSLEFRANGGPASVTDSVPDLVHIAAGGGETLVLGNILHTIDAGSANPLSNTLNPGGTGQVTSGLQDGAFTVAFEDKPLGGNSDRDFNDALFAVEPLVTAEEIVAV